MTDMTDEAAPIATLADIQTQPLVRRRKGGGRWAQKPSEPKSSAHGSEILPPRGRLEHNGYIVCSRVRYMSIDGKECEVDEFARDSAGKAVSGEHVITDVPFQVAQKLIEAGVLKAYFS